MSAAVLRVLVLTEPASFDTLCGISHLERLLRMLERCGIDDATLAASDPDQLAGLLRPNWARPKLRLEAMAGPPSPLRAESLATLAADGRLLVLPAAGYIDPRLLRALVARGGPAALVDSDPRCDPLLGTAPAGPKGLTCGPLLVDGAWLAGRAGLLDEHVAAGLEDGSLAPLDVARQPAYWPGLRRSLRPIWFPAPTDHLRAAAERRLADATQKGAQDLPALLHAPVEKWLALCLCRTKVTPNQVTLAVNILAWTATMLFATGWLWVGTGAALAVGLLDGVDGKLARLKVETTRFGRLEHLFDSLFEHSWWLALAYHFQSTGLIPNGLLLALTLMAADLLDIGAAGAVLWRTGRTMDDRTIADRAFRLIAGRRNIYIFMLTGGLLLGAAAQAFLLIVGWAVATAALRLLRAAWILAPVGRVKARRGATVET